MSLKKFQVIWQPYFYLALHTHSPQCQPCCEKHYVVA